MADTAKETAAPPALINPEIKKALSAASKRGDIMFAFGMAAILMFSFFPCRLGCWI